MNIFVWTACKDNENDKQTLCCKSLLFDLVLETSSNLLKENILVNYFLLIQNVDLILFLLTFFVGHLF